MATAIRKPKAGYSKELSPRVQAKLETLRRKSVRIDRYGKAKAI